MVLFHGITIWKHLKQAKELPTFKDNDFTQDQRKLYVGEDRKIKIKEILTRDTEVGIKSTSKYVRIKLFFL